jgi:hypothetical protein
LVGVVGGAARGQSGAELVLSRAGPEAVELAEQPRHRVPGQRLGRHAQRVTDGQSVERPEGAVAGCHGTGDATVAGRRSPMKAFTVAAVQIAPLPGPLTAESVKGNLAKASDWVTRAVESSGAELVVLPESVTTGFTPGLGPEELWDLVSEVPGPVVEPLQETARRLGVHVVVGTYARGAERGSSTTPRCCWAGTARWPASTARRTRSAPRCVPAAAG